MASRLEAVEDAMSQVGCLYHIWTFREGAKSHGEAAQRCLHHLPPKFFLLEKRTRSMFDIESSFTAFLKFNGESESP